MQKIVTFLWFNDNAEEALNFYTNVFPDSRVKNVSRYGPAGPGTPGSVMSATIELAGQEFMLLNGGPHFSFTPAISLFVRCRDQAEVDSYWTQLLAGGEESQCGWLKDRFGLSWQIIPDALGRLLSDRDPGRATRAMQAMLRMKKIDVAELERAANAA